MKTYIKASLLFIAFLPISAFAQEKGNENCNARSAAGMFSITNPPKHLTWKEAINTKIDPVKKSMGAVRKSKGTQ